jgi:hypothetical protein
VESLGNLDTLITFLDPAVANQFVLFELCASCAMQKGFKEIIPAMADMLKDYSFDETTAPSFQRLQQRLADAALHTGDTAMALNALDQVAAARQNDFALWALEEKGKIYAIQQDIPNQYLAQTKYLDAMELRVNADTRVVVDEPRETYLKASQQIRLDRAQLVTKNDEALKDKRPEAINDYENLERTRYKDRKYTDEIKVLKGREASAFSPGALSSVHEVTLSTSALAADKDIKIATADGFINPSALLTQPALVDPGVVSRFNTGVVMEHNNIEQLKVAILTHPKEEKVFEDMTGRLTDFGYIVDRKRSSMDLDVNNRVVKAPTVIYSHPEMEVKAYHLARMLSRAYSKEFQVLPADKISEQINFFKESGELDFVVYWE